MYLEIQILQVNICIRKDLKSSRTEPSYEKNPLTLEELEFNVSY